MTRRPCLVDGCWELGTGTYCPGHARQKQRADTARRGSPSQRGYDHAYRKARAQVLEDAGYICVYCGRQADTADHVQPLSRGGSGTVDNLVAACRSCNSSRGARW